MTTIASPLVFALLLLNTLTPTAPPPSRQASRSIDDSAAPGQLEMGWSTPPAGRPSALAAWHTGYSQQMRPILSAWSRLLRRLQGDLPAMFDPQCVGLVSSLERLEEAALLPAPDRLIDFYLRRLLMQLHAAAVACTRQELFNVVYRLEEARSNLGEIRWLLSRQGLG